MKRIDLIRYLEENGCKLLREGGNHTVFLNPEGTSGSVVPRHREIKRILVVKICKDLAIPNPFAH
ncbi:MAG: type II toxin-antitoxin system HicA family toxin [Acidobacteriaceae bacterium]